jgi:hypothetical protein
MSKSQTVGELLTATLADIGAGQVFGVVGDALNPFTDAIRRASRRLRRNHRTRSHPSARGSVRGASRSCAGAGDCRRCTYS